mmetsp:Transcript_29724/g.43253  ORF Transcript_29724/g.43253 Transcript_29724/m.43253 type:complete len:372 (-) Transcript_29724:148-1263(-)
MTTMMHKKSRKQSQKTKTMQLLFASIIVIHLIFFNIILLKDNVTSTGATLHSSLSPPLLSPPLSSSFPNKKKSVLVIAISPNSHLKYAATWSILQCFASEFDKIIIASPKPYKLSPEFQIFIQKVHDRMPEIGSSLEVHYFKNLRYDFGLWCDALTNDLDNGVTSILQKKSNESSYIGGRSEYDQFMLINDSMMAVKKSNEFLDALEKRNADLISLSYWGNNVDRNDGFWVESPLRVFSLRGIQMYADEICPWYTIDTYVDCPWVKGNNIQFRPKKKCIVDKTEVRVAKLYPPDKVFGLYPGSFDGKDGKKVSWVSEYKFYEELRDKMSFPVTKVSNKEVFKMVRELRPEDTNECSSLYYQMIEVDKELGI